MHRRKGRWTRHSEINQGMTNSQVRKEARKEEIKESANPDRYKQQRSEQQKKTSN